MQDHSLWRAGKAAAAEAAQPVGALVGATLFTATAMTCMSLMAAKLNFGGAAQACYVLPAVLAMMGLGVQSICKAVEGFNHGISEKFKSDAPAQREALHKGMMNVGIGAISAVAFAGSLAALGALRPFAQSSSAWVYVPAAAACIGAWSVSLASAVSGSFGVMAQGLMHSADQKDPQVEAPLSPANLKNKLSKRRDHVAPISALLHSVPKAG